MKKLLIATITGMIEKQDVKDLESFCDIDWIVREKIEDIELANIAKDYDYLMLNFDIVENLSEEFYNIVSNSRLKVISTDITGMDWAKPRIAKQKGIYLLNTSNYCTESVAEYTITQMLLFALETAKKMGKKTFRLFTYSIWHAKAQGIYKRTMKLEESYTNKDDNQYCITQGKPKIFSISLTDKIVEKWKNKFIDLSSENELHIQSLKQMTKDGLFEDYKKYIS